MLNEMIYFVLFRLLVIVIWELILIIQILLKKFVATIRIPEVAVCFG